MFYDVGVESVFTLFIELYFNKSASFGLSEADTWTYEYTTLESPIKRILARLLILRDRDMKTARDF